MATVSTDEFGLIRSDQEESEESYFISMTDIMVGLLFIFIIMLMAFGLMLKVAEEKTATKRAEQSLEAIEEAIEESEQEISNIRQIDNLRAQMLQDIERRLSEIGIQVVIDQENGILRLPDKILFDTAKAELKDEGLIAVGRLARALDEVLPCYARVPSTVTADAGNCELPEYNQLRLEAVFVEGHTDSTGSDDLNWKLSTERAINTFREMDERSDVAIQLLNDSGQSLFSVAGYGENRPVVEETDDETRQQNRRIDLRFVMNVSHEEALKKVQNRLIRVRDELRER